MPNVTDIYSEYVRLRQNGASIDAAIKALQSLVDQLDQGDRSQLNLLVRQWEARETNNYLLEKTKDTPPPPKKSPVIRPIGGNSATPSGGTSSPIKPLPSAAPDVNGFGDHPPAGKVFCSQCGKQNRQGDKYCYACGSLLATAGASVGSTKGLIDQSGDPRERLGTAYFGMSSKILIMIQGVSIPVSVFSDKEIVLGRSSADSPMKPDVDLSSFDAEGLGVSRLHASLKRDEHTVQIMDLSSKNHTFINNQRLHPREVRVLRDGDEVRLGRLSFTITFRHS
ncbi:MAG TPA: FHA domain-containing protein [Aggregatilineales bacterium]|nr:FHA domain-containing protein [Anaerolineales bacterium]HRE47900.1 FHA domain-containing protein [Aggregatilineales bacterium]